MTYTRSMNNRDHPTHSPFGWSPGIDLAESDGAYLISLDLPGVSRESIEVTWRDRILAVSGERLPEEGAGRALRQERAFGRFYRAFTIPGAVRADRIEASFEDGILTIKAPKMGTETPLRIPVR